MLFFNKNKLILDKNIVRSYCKIRADKNELNLCNAPFKSLLFIPTGEIMACHYNRGYVLGQYPKNSIKEVWTGDKINILRQNIIKYDFSSGCYECYKDFIQRKFLSVGASKYDFIEPSSEAYPSLMEFQLSNQCNLECTMCSGEYSSGIRQNREKMPNYPSPYDDAFVDELKAFIPYLKKAYFTGGEPFVIPIYRNIWQQIQALNPELMMNISTNASIIDDSIKETLKNGNFFITVSIDTLNPENYEKLRKNALFDVTIKNIDYLHQYALENSRIFSIKFVLIDKNIDDIPHLFEFFNNKNVQLFPKFVWLPFKYSLFNLRPKELSEKIILLEKIRTTDSTLIQKENKIRLKEVINELKKWQHVKAKENEALYSMSLLQMSQLLEKKLIIEIKKSHLNNKETITEIHKYVSLIATINISEGLLKNGFMAFLKIPAELILSEILRGHEEKFKARFIEECYI